MSDLQCAATLIVARHAEAAFVEDWCSDEGRSLIPSGSAQADALAASLEGRRIASVFTSDTPRAVQTAEIVATRFRVSVTACKSLREVFMGALVDEDFDVSQIHAVTDQWYAGSLEVRFDGGESGAEVVERHRKQFEEIADLHRGETALVIGHQTALGIVVPTLSRQVTAARPKDTELTNAEFLELENDAEGWALRRSPA